MFRICLAAVAALALSLNSMAGEPGVAKELEKISHQIAYINTFGQWREGKVGGSYRIILMDAKEQFPHSKIFLQWIEQVDPDSDARIVAMAPVAEINNVGVYKLSVPRIIREGQEFMVELTAINQYSQSVQNIQLVPDGVGKYTFRYAATPYAQQVDAAVSKIPLKLDYYVRPTF